MIAAATLLSGLLTASSNPLTKSLGKAASNTANSLAQSAQSTLSGGTDKLKKTAQDFETMFLENVYDRVTSNLGESGPLGSNGTGGDIWRGMLTQQYAKATSQAGGVGLSNDIYSALLKLQSGQTQTSDAAGTTASRAASAAAKT